MNNKAIRVVLTGKVQKVGFRKWIRDKANEVGVSGWVKNRNFPGTAIVDLMLEGPIDSVHSLLTKIMTGNGESEISEISVLEATPHARSSFNILYREDEEPAIAARESLQKTLLSYRRVTRALSETVLQSTSRLHKSKDLSNVDAQEVRTSILLEHLPPHTSKIFQGCGSNIFEGCSFSSETWAQSKKRDIHGEIAGHRIEFLLEDKKVGLHFAKLVGLRVPKILQRNIPISALDFSPNSVIKPTRGGGSTGVYIIKDSANIINVRDRSRLTSIKELQASMQCVLSENHGRRDSWIVEEMIIDKEGGPPNDLKFYVFYGQSPLVLEVSRFGEKPLYSWRNREGEIANVGQPQYSYFEGREIPENFCNLVEEISLKIPAPFVRIDLFDSSEGLVFGEFTPRPGSSHNFDLSADRMLGRHFINARARLFNDLYTGKKFPEFDSIINEYRR